MQTLQEFDFEIKYRPGKANVVANFLSQLQVPNDLVAIDDIFPNEHLFCIDSFTPWYADLEKYLAIGRKTPHFSPK